MPTNETIIRKYQWLAALYAFNVPFTACFATQYGPSWGGMLNAFLCGGSLAMTAHSLFMAQNHRRIAWMDGKIALLEEANRSLATAFVEIQDTLSTPPPKPTTH